MQLIGAMTSWTLAKNDLFELLSEFQGCTIEAVEGVTSGIELVENAELDILDGLTSLVDKSLIRQEDQKTGESALL